MNIFGLNGSVSGDGDIDLIRSTENQISTINEQDIAMRNIEQFASSHDAVRKETIAAPNKEVLPIGYHISDDILLELDVQLEDQGMN
jgi:hypothetical protein